MQEWNDLYVATAGASAALTGLIFVGISINLTKILSIPGLPDRALISLVLLLNILVVSILFLVPRQTTNAQGVELTITGFLVWIMIFRFDLRIFRSKERSYKMQYVLNFLVNQVAIILFILAGVTLITGYANSGYLIVPAIILSTIKSVLDGWVLLVEINR
jgi:hypothetical protein